MQISQVDILAAYTCRPIHTTKSRIHNRKLVGNYRQMKYLETNEMYFECSYLASWHVT